MSASHLRRNAQLSPEQRQLAKAYHLHLDEQTLRLLAQERARADRNAQPLSLILFDITILSRAPLFLEQFIRIVTDRTRVTDHIGWLDRTHLALILPETPGAGAQTLQQEINMKYEAYAQPVSSQTFTYPQQSIPALAETVKSHNPGSGRDKGPPATEENADHADAGGKAVPPVSQQSFARIEPLLLPATTVCKRGLDLLAASLAVVFFAPLLLLIALGIKFASRGPVLYQQTRVGYLGRPFKLLKFRTMHSGARKDLHSDYLKELIHKDRPMVKLDAQSDPRIFPFGRFLRQTGLDELPQLVNVLKGEMSLVGPRPCLPYEAENYSLWHWRRLDCMPGMTGLWQISGKNETTFKEMVRLDIAYTNRRSVWFDLKIMLMTIPSIIKQARAHSHPTIRPVVRG